MTLSATDRILYQACETNTLVERKPFRPLVQEARCKIFVTPYVDEVLSGRVGKFGPMAEMEKIIATVAAGYAVSVSLLGDPNGQRPDLERLADLDEAWTFCARTPRMLQVRLFGRFAAKGVFIGLDIHDRSWLGDRTVYNAKAATIPDQWSGIFGERLQPHRGQSVRDYLNGVPRDVDEIREAK